MMKVMLAAIEIFSLVYQRIFAQKVLTQRKHSRVWECFVWGMYFVISNFFTYSFAKSAWDNTGIFVVSFFFALRILYIDSALGVSQTADEDTIKKAYRKAAKECHPDTHPGDKRAEERFKEIGEAYRILSDKQKREEYNARAAQKEQKSAAGRNSAGTCRNGAGTGRKNTGGGTIDPGDIEKEFERFFSMGKQSEKKENRTQQKINPMDVTDLFERYMGLKR